MRGLPLRYSLRNLWRRPVRTALTLLGLSLLVALIVFLTAFGRSFGRALREPGHPRTIVVLSKKAQTIELSSISPSDLDTMRASLGDDLEEDPEVGPLFSREVYHMVSAVLLADPEEKSRRALFHGVEPPLVPKLFQRFRLTRGRLPEEGSFELLVGRAVANRLRAKPEWLALDAEVELRGEVFTVVGEFEAPGTLYENWMITHPWELLRTLNRTDYSFGRLRLRSGADPEAVAERITADERYEVQAFPEPEYFADFAEGFAHFERFATLLAILLAVGGVITGMNTLHNAVVGRTREIGMLRVLGFGKAKIFAAFLLEALLLTGLAGAVGCGLGIVTDGLPVKTPIAAAFPVVVDLGSLLTGFSTALLMGVLGLAFPMVRALRLPAGRAVRAA
jgi:ABC-type antimicrobial peptide transport system permease subunit